MKIIVSIITICCFLFHGTAYAVCDFSKEITPGPNDTYIYSKACHLQVGQIVQDNAMKTKQIVDLSKALTLKDLSIQESDKRATLWMNTSSSLEDRLTKVDSLQKNNDVLFFALGAATMFLAAFAASKMVAH